jgi:hypothetical protein
MENVAEILINQVTDGFDRILRLSHAAPDYLRDKPALPNGWSIKDMVAHLAAWDWRCAAVLSEALNSDVPLTCKPDVQALNREIYQERQYWSWGEVENDFRAAHRILLQIIRSLPPDRLAHPVVKRTIIEETLEHYRQHMPDLETWHKQFEVGLVNQF